MKIKLLRHATLLVNFNGKILLVDPMLSTAGTMPPIVNSTNTRCNPLVEISWSEKIVKEVHAVLLTHMHRDHFDDAAAKQLTKDKLIFCQPADEMKLKELGFYKVYPIHDSEIWEGIKLIRTGGQHGTGEIGIKMAPVSGYILQAKNEPSLYIAGDTIYCKEVEHALHTYKPNITVVNAGAAQFSVGEPITMTAHDVVKVCRFLPQTKVVAVHMEAINHCLMSRIELSEYIQKHELENKVLIPADGQRLLF